MRAGNRMNPDLRDWLCQQLRPLVDVRFCAPPPVIVERGRAAGPALRIGLWTGVYIHVHCLDEAPGTRQLRRILQRDEEASSASLFMLAPALAPPPDQRFAAPDWLLALHELGNQRVYVCSARGQAPGVQPVHLEALEGGQRHVARYGPQLLPRRLHAGRVNIRRRSVRGFWNLAHFGAEAFWQRATQDRFAAPGPDFERQAPGMSQAENEMARCYALLGVAPDAGQQQVREAFRRQALNLHPDVSALPTALAEERFRRVAEAWEQIRSARGWP